MATGLSHRTQSPASCPDLFALQLVLSDVPRPRQHHRPFPRLVRASLALPPLPFPLDCSHPGSAVLVSTTLATRPFSCTRYAHAHDAHDTQHHTFLTFASCPVLRAHRGVHQRIRRRAPGRRRQGGLPLLRSLVQLGVLCSWAHTIPTHGNDMIWVCSKPTATTMKKRRTSLCDTRRRCRSRVLRPRPT